MQRILVCLSMLALLLVAGCPAPQPLPNEWGRPYEDVVVPPGFEQYDDPPFKREDSAGGKRIYGVYSFRSKGLYPAADFANFEKTELARLDWKFVREEMDEPRGIWKLRFEKGGDRLDVSIAPDKVTNTSDSFSIITVKLNDPHSN